jgi:hypothetical protein
MEERGNFLVQMLSITCLRYTEREGEGVGTLWADLTAEQRKQGSGASAQSAKQWLHRSASAVDRSTAAAGRSEPNSSPTCGEDDKKGFGT